MIVVHAVLRSKPERRAETVAALRALQEATLANDDGCLHYAFCADITDDCLFTCVEEWRDMDALRAHLAAPHMNDPASPLADTTIGDEQIRVFHAEPTSLA